MTSARRTFMKPSGITIRPVFGLASLCGNDGFKFGHVVNRSGNRLYFKARSSSREGVQIVFESTWLLPG